MSLNIHHIVDYVENYSFHHLKKRFLTTFKELDEYQYILVEECLRDFYLASFLLKKELTSSPIKTLSPPNYIVDELWHLHIIYTKSYFNFCSNVFGEYLHHNPTENISNDLIDYQILYDVGNIVKNYRHYQLNDLNTFKNHPRFSLLSQINEYLNETPYEKVLML